jgi:hypothetical protein
MTTSRESYRKADVGRNDVEFIRALPNAGKLFIRAARFDGKTKGGNFNLGAISEIRNKIAFWPDSSGENHVGSIDHPERR